MIAKRYLFSGRVQGVGFRYSAKQLALGFDVTGWVSNLDDGRVEMQVMGEPLEVADFLQEMHDSPLGHHILEQEEYDIPLLKNARGFSIL
ncbi:MAG: acylphosphatase [Verrucomicrobiales bacterium]|nr:acylphosphatase [Verrucomicrobiae bacterium]MCP5555215.1 acylphosphatase [Akkermansiaceae bacterium]